MSKFKNQKLELLFEFLISKHGNFVAKFKDGTTNTFAVKHVPKFFEI
jgi:hypothetical protein